jgi:hypothetical protein
MTGPIIAWGPASVPARGHMNIAETAGLYGLKGATRW